MDTNQQVISGPGSLGIIRRHLAERIQEALKTSRIVNIVGPRQSGKSTLVEHQVPVARYLTMDDDQLRAAIESDPYTVLADIAAKNQDSGKPIAIDEVQRAPSITLALKRIVDADNTRGQFLLTGSSNIFTSPKSIDSLAGRVMTLTLRPLSGAEIKRTAFCRLLDDLMKNPNDLLGILPKSIPYTRAEAIDLMVRGGFPEIRELNDKDRGPRYRSYLNSIIEKDVPTLAQLRKPDDLRRFMHQLGARTGSELNVSKLASDLGIARHTLDTWLDVLSALGVVHRLPGWTSSRAKKAIKSPKLHFMDTGCATAIRYEVATSFAVGGDPVALGAIFESYVFTEIEKTLPLLDTSWELYHWRSDPKKVDIVAEAPGKTLALFEMKASGTVTAGDFKNMDWFWENPGKSFKGTGFVVYLGDQLLPFGPRKIALPLSIFWSY